MDENKGVYFSQQNIRHRLRLCHDLDTLKIASVVRAWLCTLLYQNTDHTIDSMNVLYYRYISSTDYTVTTL